MPTVTFRYGKIPGYRASKSSTGRWSYMSWGFDISDEKATDMNYGQYTCPRRRAKKLWEHLKKNAEERGFTPVLIVDAESGLDATLS